MGCPQIDSSVLSTAMSWESTLVYYRLINEEVRQRLGELHRVAEQIATAMAIPLLHIGAMDHDFYVGRLRDRCRSGSCCPGRVGYLRGVVRGSSTMVRGGVLPDNQ